MITQEEVSAIGYIAKPHGIKGEVSMHFDSMCFDEDEVEYFVFDMDGILVPFFIENFRFKTDTTALYKFQDIDSEEKAKTLAGKTIYLKKELIIEEDLEDSLKYYIGFEIQEKSKGSLGKIKDVDESTQNALFIVNNYGEELLIPATDYYITDIDEMNKVIFMDLPEGLVDMDLAEEE